MMTILNSPELAGFYALAAVAIFASLRVVTQANPVHAILSMIVLLLSIAGIMFVIGAPFAGALEIVVYAGAILVLFVFVIMMLNLGMTNEAREEGWLDAKAWAIPTGLTLVIVAVLYAMIDMNQNQAAMIGGVNIPARVVGEALFSKYIILVEMSALLLLGALVAAYHLGKESLDNDMTNADIVDTDLEDKQSALIGTNSEKYKNAPDTTDTVSMAKPYEYKEVDAHDYVGMQQSTRKESD